MADGIKKNEIPFPLPFDEGMPEYAPGTYVNPFGAAMTVENLEDRMRPEDGTPNQRDPYVEKMQNEIALQKIDSANRYADENTGNIVAQVVGGLVGTAGMLMGVPGLFLGGGMLAGMGERNIKDWRRKEKEERDAIYERYLNMTRSPRNIMAELIATMKSVGKEKADENLVNVMLDDAVRSGTVDPGRVPEYKEAIMGIDFGGDVESLTKQFQKLDLTVKGMKAGTELGAMERNRRIVEEEVVEEARKLYMEGGYGMKGGHREALADPAFAKDVEKLTEAKGTYAFPPADIIMQAIGTLDSPVSAVEHYKSPDGVAVTGKSKIMSNMTKYVAQKTGVIMPADWERKTKLTESDIGNSTLLKGLEGKSISIADLADHLAKSIPDNLDLRDIGEGPGNLVRLKIKKEAGRPTPLGGMPESRTTWIQVMRVPEDFANPTAARIRVMEEIDRYITDPGSDNLDPAFHRYMEGLLLRLNPIFRGE
jgi:hypothetical protein